MARRGLAPTIAVGAGGAAAAYAATRGARAARSVNNVPSPVFNPGSSGGYVKMPKKKRKARKKAVFSKKQRSVVRSIAINAPEPYVPVLDYKGQYLFPIQTSTGFPVTPLAGFFGQTVGGLTTVGLTPAKVGWNQIELASDTVIQTMLTNQAAKQEPWVTSGTNELRLFDFTDKPYLAKQYRFKHELDFRFELKNLSNAGARVDLYILTANDNCSVDPLSDLQQAYRDKYINSLDVFGTTDQGRPEPLPNQFDQFFHVPGAKSRSWRSVKHVTFVLNTGDEANVPMSISRTLRWASPHNDTYQKGTWAIIARVQGVLTCDKTNPSQVGMTGGNICCKMTRRYKISVQKGEFDAVVRKIPLVAGTVVTPVAAGDGNQMDLTD